MRCALTLVASSYYHDSFSYKIKFKMSTREIIKSKPTDDVSNKTLKDSVAFITIRKTNKLSSSCKNTKITAIWLPRLKGLQQ